MGCCAAAAPNCVAPNDVCGASGVALPNMPPPSVGAAVAVTEGAPKSERPELAAGAAGAPKPPNPPAPPSGAVVVAAGVRPPKSEGAAVEAAAPGACVPEDGAPNRDGAPLAAG